MSRSYRKTPIWSCCFSHDKSGNQDKTIARRIVRRVNNQLLKQEVEDYIPLPRLECRRNRTYSWAQHGHVWHFPHEKEGAPEWVVEIDIVTQVCRVLDGEPAIQEEGWSHEKWYKKKMRK